jgi:lysophospholipase L1-like esterase
VLIFYRRILGTSPEYTQLTSMDRGLLFAVSVALSYASYRWVEQPVRKRQFGGTRRSLFAGAVAASLALLVFGATGVAWDGFPARVDAKVAAIAKFSTYRFGVSYERGRCFLDRPQTFGDLKSECLQMAPSQPNLLVWGDSVAAHYIYGLRKLAPQFDLNILHATSSACAPLFDLDHPGRPNCRAFNDGIRAFIEKNAPDGVALSAVWNVEIAEFGYAKVIEHLRQTMAEIAKHGVQVFVLGPPIQYIDRLPYILSQYAVTGLDRFDTRKFIDPKLSELDGRLSNELLGMEHVHYISVLDAVCDQRKCPFLLDGLVPMQWDKHHLTNEGSVLVAERLLPAVTQVLKSGR